MAATINEEGASVMRAKTAQSVTIDAPSARRPAWAR
jgi:hypothetical protein